MRGETRDARTPGAELGEAMMDFLERLEERAAEARDLYAEWGEIPGAEALERHSENVETIIPPSDPANLTPPARAAS